MCEHDRKVGCESGKPIGRLAIARGDITTFAADAIVNAASHSLLGLAGVSGAILKAAGPELVEECRALGGCEEGHAKTTRAYALPARFVIHTVGPIWRGGLEREEETLRRCYRSCLALVAQHGLRTVAFPCIGTGAHGFPLDNAAHIALRECVDFLSRNDDIEMVTIVCFDQPTYEVYASALSEVRGARHRQHESGPE